MRLVNEIVVTAPLEQTWPTLLDVPRVARALPGASVEPEAAEGAYPGRLKVRLGPVALEYEGVVRLADVDEDARVASFHLQGREVRGSGGASATITNRLLAEGDRTRVVVETDVAVTGRAAQFGQGLMEDVAGRLLQQFSAHLEAEVLAPGTHVTDAPSEALDLGGAAWGPLVSRYAWLPAVAAGFIIGFAAGRRSAG
jgi:carbon monoxide dehydrogenase subunit G